MMAMSKMLGISPKSIGQGGWLDVASLRSNSSSSAEHSLLSKPIDQSIVKATLKYKYSTLSGLAHEWWHALDHALSYFETGKGKVVASEIPSSRFTGRKETWDAVQQVIKAIKKSGHESRMYSLKFPRRYTDYLVEPSEMAARAFDEYIKSKFVEAGIQIENATDTVFVAQPTAEEMAVIAPAFDNLFNVLQEKEGKNPGTSVLYHIGEEVDERMDGISDEAVQLAIDTVMQALRELGIDVESVTDEQVAQMLKSSKFVEMMGTKVNNRRLAIAQYFAGKQLNETEQSIVNAFANGVKDESIIITRNGTNKRIHLKQGNENKAGVSHSILRHYNTTSNNYTDAELLLIPDIIKNGTEVKNGNKITYRYTANGITYTVTTEIHDRQEYFSNYITDRKPTTRNSSNTVNQHVHPQQSVSTANVSNNSATTNSGNNTNSLLRTLNGIVYGWTDGKKIYLTEAGINPNTPIHEYTHLWAIAMMQKNPKGWQSVKDLLRGTPVWDAVLNDAKYSDIHNNEDAVASEVLSRISGTKNAAKLEKMAQQMIDEAKGTMRKLEARGLVQRIKDALNEFWSWVGTELFGIEKFESVDQITDRVLWDLMNKTDLGELSEGQVETQIVTDSKKEKENSISLQENKSTEDAYTDNDSRGVDTEAEGVQGEVSMSEPLREEGRLYNPEGNGVSQNAYARFNPISKRDGESDRQRDIRETRFFASFEKLTSDEKVLFYNFLSEYLSKSSGILKGRTDAFLEPIKSNGNTSLLSVVQRYIN